MVYEYAINMLYKDGKLSLKRIDLHNNKLQVFSIGTDASIDSLYELLLSRNRLNELDNVDVAAVNLTIIDISNNVFDDIPSSIFQLEHLKRLDFSSNQLKSLPPRLGTMTNLQVISWEGNPLRSPPRNMSGSLDVLKSLRDILQTKGWCGCESRLHSFKGQLLI
jgi:Leucine-rich repeat (LRR) protein